MTEKDAQFVLEAWTKKINEEAEEQKLRLLLELGREITDFLLHCKVERATEGLNYEDKKFFSVLLQHNDSKLNYSSTGVMQEDTLSSSPLTKHLTREAITKTLLPFLSSLNLYWMKYHLMAARQAHEQFSLFLNRFQCPITQIHYCVIENDGVFEVCINKEAYRLVPKIKREHIAREKLKHDFDMLEVNELPGDDSPVSWLSELSGVPIATILNTYKNVGSEEEPHITEADAYQFLHEDIGEEKYIHNKLQSRNYTEIIGKETYEEEILGNQYLYRVR